MQRCWFVAWLLLAVFVGCDDGGSSGGGDAAVGPSQCEDDRRRCTDDGVEVCVEGQWRALGPCVGGTTCNDGACEPVGCEPDCNGRICGSDGCDGTCGECDAGWTCSLEGRCDPPAARCGDAICNGDEDCTTCPADCGNCCGDGTCDVNAGETCATCLADCGCAGTEVCNAQTQACEACEAQCDGRTCGDDGCGDVCGTCAEGVACENGVCPCVPQCDGRACGADGCGGTCGDCDGGQVCDAQGQCEAPPARCGDNACGEGEDCANCPADCGRCCGDGQCADSVGENCATCPVDCACGDGQRCEVEQARCVEQCVPRCQGRACGDDGCGGTCGQCDGDAQCNAMGQCEMPPAQCGNNACEPGEDCANCPADCGACCGDGQCAPAVGENCATCPADCRCDDTQRCDVDRAQCVAQCVPQCDGRACGPDGCGGQCGQCGNGQVCGDMGQCEQAPAQCGNNACEPGENCANCPADCGACCGDGQCEAAVGENCATCPADCRCDDAERCDVDRALCVARCNPQCEGRNCGDDGCGGVCGNCLPNQDCEAGVCRDQCAPACAGRDCGGDGCGGTCGAGCADNEICDDGQCAEVCSPNCQGRVCGSDGCGGFCGACDAGEQCDDAGQCLAICTPACDGRACGDDGCGGVCGVCDDGSFCANDGQCVGGSGLCDCPDGEICLDAICREPGELCSPAEPHGLCPSGSACVAGVCEAGGHACGPDNLTGLCPPDEICADGTCEVPDDVALCSDRNTCTQDFFDPTVNACRNVAIDAACDDGNACTTNMCEAGRCVATPILGCLEPPHVDPATSPTPHDSITLRGTKIRGASIVINGEEAVEGTPDVDWSHSVDLQPGENVFEVQSNNLGQLSETVTIRIVRDDVSPTLNVSPAGGMFLNPVTITVAASEASTVYYTDDGTEPGAASRSFRSMKRFRVLNDVNYRFRARDDAGNWQADTTLASYEITGDDNGWSELAPIPAPVNHATSGYMSNHMYVVGGTDGAESLSTTWVLSALGDNPGTWAPGPALAVPRAEMASVIYRDQMFVFGGESNGIPLNFAQRLTAGEPAWVNLSPMPSTRFGAAAGIYRDQIFVFGGKSNGGAVLTNVESFSIHEDTWSNQHAQMPRARYGHRAVSLRNQIFLVGGEDANGTPIAEVDVYNIDLDEWTVLPPLPTPRTFPTVTLDRNRGTLHDGQVELVVAGGRLADGSATATVEAIDLVDQTWRPRTPLAAPRHGAAGTAVPWAGGVDGHYERHVIVGGVRAGEVSDHTASYTRHQDYLTPRVDLPAGRTAHAAVELNGVFYVFGGTTGQGTQHFWGYDPETGRTTSLPELPSVQIGLSGLVHGNRVYALGGTNEAGLAVPHLRAYDLVLRRWIDLAPMPTARAEMAVAIIQGELWTIGGANNGALQTVEIYTPETNTWRAGTALPEGRAGARAIWWNGAMRVTGGTKPDGTLHRDVLRYFRQEWVATMVLPRISHHQAAASNNRLIIAGGRTPAGPSNTIITFDEDNYHFSRPLTEATNLLEPVEQGAMISHQGQLWILGGDTSLDAGADALSSVRTLNAGCFNGGEGPGPERIFGHRGICGREADHQEGDARIGRGIGQLGRAGLLEVFHDGQWGLVCDDAFNEVNVEVVCAEVFGVRHGGFSRSSADGRVDFWLDNVGCVGDEDRLSECPNLGWGVHNCGSNEVVYVTCRLR